MSSFIKQLISNGDLIDFNFTRIFTVHGSKYFVVTRDSAMEYHFMIENSKGDWKINGAPAVPQWIHDLGSQLVSIILENELANYPRHS